VFLYFLGYLFEVILSTSAIDIVPATKCILGSRPN
jgi:hypothetical protein